MEKGFVRDMLDVKILVLFTMSRVAYPIDLQKIYDLVYQDDRLSYFDLAEAVPQMVDSGHLEMVEEGKYMITSTGGLLRYGGQHCLSRNAPGPDCCGTV